MVSGVRNSCDSLPPKVRRYCVCSLRRASSRSKPRDRAPISSALADSGMSRRIFPSTLTAESAALRKRPIRRLIQLAKPNMTMTAQAVVSTVALNRRVTARSRSPSNWSPACSRNTAPRVPPSTTIGAAAVNSNSWLPARRIHSACGCPASAARALCPSSRSGIDTSKGKLEVSMRMNRRYQDPALRSVSPGRRVLTLPATPSFNAFVSMTVARVPSRMNVPNKSSRPGIVKNKRPPSGKSAAVTPDLPAPWPSRASIQRREPTNLNGMRASRW